MSDHVVACPECEGRTWVQMDDPDNLLWKSKPCPACGGRGQVVRPELVERIANAIELHLPENVKPYAPRMALDVVAVLTEVFFKEEPNGN